MSREKPAVPATGSQQDPRSTYVLVADDDDDMREWLREALESAGYIVLEAADGEKAMNLLKREKIDLFITDLSMPNQEGIETIQMVRHDYPRLKVIAISGAFHGEYLRAAKLLGAAATLQKPIQLDELLQTAQKLLNA